MQLFKNFYNLVFHRVQRDKKREDKTPSLFFRATVVFILFFSLFLSLHLLSPGLTSSDDPYYHAKHAYLIAQSGQLDLMKPWLEFNFFNFAPADLWWGFHLGMALFIYWFGLFFGVKIFISLLAALVFLIFYVILNKLNLRAPWFWTGFLFFSSQIFIYRLFLERPHLLPIIVLPLAFYLLVKERNFWLFILTLIYTLSYVLAPVMIFEALIYLAADWFVNKRLNLRPIIATAGGVLAGIIIHPNSLNYVYGMYTQHWLVLFLRFTGVDLSIGSEVRLTNFVDYLYSNLLALIFCILAGVLFFILKKPKTKVITVFLFVYTVFWALVSLVVPRGVEYWLPAIFLLSAFIYNDFAGSEEFETIKKFLIDRVNLKIVGFFVISALAVAVLNNLSNTFFDLYNNNTASLSQSYGQANGWLKTHTGPGAVIFYDNWGMWPMMFFNNDYNHYVIGVDPTSTYEYDQPTFWLWHHISGEGLYCDQPQSCYNLSPRDQIKLVPLAIKTIFRSNYVVTANRENSGLLRTLNNLKSEVSLVFKNKELLIYKIK